jgi:hypothetical protein
VGSLLVESEPPGAAVYVDGRLAGDTPLALPTIATGEHRVRLIRLGYLERSQVVTVKPGTRATLRARLTDPAPQAPAAAALRIVVLEGENAVNIIQQKTAVSPVVEVRDRNDQPVSGAIVKFAIQKGKATFDGARTLTVTTNAAGRATAIGFTPVSHGALQIAASAAFQGQTATATIAQTTVVTAAQAASVASGTGAAASGGGLSHVAIAGIAAGAGAAAVGAVLLNKGTSNNTVTGTWVGDSGPTTGGGTGGTLTLNLVQTGGQLTGSFGFVKTNGRTSNAPISGSVIEGAGAGAPQFTLSFSSLPFQDSSGCTSQLTNVTAQVTGSTMQANVTTVDLGPPANCGSTTNTSTQVQVTLTRR